jgi:hypothetical protein
MAALAARYGPQLATAIKNRAAKEADKAANKIVAHIEGPAEVATKAAEVTTDAKKEVGGELEKLEGALGTKQGGGNITKLVGGIAKRVGKILDRATAKISKLGRSKTRKSKKTM